MAVGRSVSALGIVVTLIGCDQRPAEVAPASVAAVHQWFADATDSTRVSFTNDTGPFGDYFMPDSMGSGGAAFDYDNDGRLDLLLLQQAGPDSGKAHVLLHQRADGTFEDVSQGSGLDLQGHGMGVACGDVNNDGFVDVAITAYKGVGLFVNERGSGKFTDVTASAGIDNPHWGASAAFVDYDNDGMLDLVVANYIAYEGRTCEAHDGTDFCGPADFPGTPAKLFRNRTAPGSAGGAVQFQDVSRAAGIEAKPGAGLGVLCVDFTDDGWQDIFVANDGQPNHLWVNQKDGTFKEEAIVRGVAQTLRGTSVANMGIGVGDYDFNGRLDVLVTHLHTEHHILWSQTDLGIFIDVTAKVGLTNVDARGTGFGVSMTDFDNDGALDVAIVNGSIVRNRASPAAPTSPLGPWAAYAQPANILAGRGGKFEDVSARQNVFCGEAAVARGLVSGDFDDDGGVDLVACRVQGPTKLFRNVATPRGNWLQVRAVDPRLGGRDAYGATVAVSAGGRRYVKAVAPSYSYMSSNDPRVHVGLGSTTQVDGIDVTWPGGSRERFDGRPANQVVVLKRDAGRPVTEYGSP